MITYNETDENDLELISDMWKKLIHHLQSKSKYFPMDYQHLLFETRKDQLKNIAESGKLRLDIVKDGENYLAYSVSSIVDEKGSIDSLYVDKQHRNEGIGNELMKRTLNWMELNDVPNFEILVSYGNEDALKFYEKYNFYPKHLILKKK
jgi:ribosomal protein S18 acetylase RimI-like enzyme